MVKILAIDDKRNNLLTLEALIKDTFTDSILITAPNGPKGIKLAITEDPDVILLDIRMPDMDGFEVYRLMKLDKRIQDIPVIFLTVKDDKESRIKALDLGAEAFLSKPIDTSEFTAQIKAMIKLKTAKRLKLEEKDLLAFLVEERTRELEQSQTATLKALNKLKKENNLRKQAEEDLQQTQLIMRSSLDSPKDMIIISVDKSYNYLYFNKTHKDLMKFVYNKDVKIGMNILDCMTPGKDREDLKLNFDRALEGESYITIREFGYIKKSWYETKFNPILNDSNEIIGITTFANDITERKQAEYYLRKSEERFRQVTESSGEWIWEVDTKGVYTFASSITNSLLGYKSGEIVGKKHFYDFFPPYVKEKLKAAAFEIFAKKESFNNFENPNLHKNGHIVILETSGHPILDDDGNLLGYRGSDKNITERKHAEVELIAAKEKAEESDRLKSAFLTNLSHEIRTPMNGILGFADLLREPGLSGEEQQEYINIITISGDRMLNIINDIMSISQIEAGQVELNLDKVNINDQIECIYTFFKPEIETKGIQFLSGHPLPSDESIITTDNEKVYSILSNIIKNAIKFTSKGLIEFGYTLKKADAPTSTPLSNPARNTELEFYVKDSGIGISKDKLDAIFDRFVQADITNTRAFEGAGLGLSIAKAYVEMLGGRIWVESEPGKGSTFYFTLPYNPETREDPSTKIESQPSAEVIPTKTLKILIAEDDESSQIFLSLAVQSFAKEIICVRTGLEAVAACHNNSDIDLVLMDIRMPEMDGYEATRQIRKFNKDVIIIAQTAYAFKGENEKAIAAGCNDYISKPIKVNSLKQKINKHLNML